MAIFILKWSQTSISFAFSAEPKYCPTLYHLYSEHVAHKTPWRLFSVFVDISGSSAYVKITALCRFLVYITNISMNYTIFRDDYVNLKEPKAYMFLTYWGQDTYMCISTLTIVVSGDGFLPSRCQVIIRTNAGILLIGPIGTNFNEILIENHTSSFKTINLNMTSGKWHPFCLNVLRQHQAKTYFLKSKTGTSYMDMLCNDP